MISTADSSDKTFVNYYVMPESSSVIVSFSKFLKINTKVIKIQAKARRFLIRLSMK